MVQEVKAVLGELLGCVGGDDAEIERKRLAG